MRIAVDTRFIKPGSTDAFDLFITEALQYLAKAHAADSFFYLLDAGYDQQLISSGNIDPVVLKSPKIRSTGPVGRWFNEAALAGALRKLKVDVFFCPGGRINLSTGIPQVMLIHELDFLLKPAFFSRRRLFLSRRLLPKFLLKANNILVTSHFLKEEITRRFKIGTAVLQVTGIAAGSVFRPLDWSEKETIKEKYNKGREFFFVRGDGRTDENLLEIFKAFSIFKKRQLSNMQLIIDSRLQDEDPGLGEKLVTYKYRSDVSFRKINNKNELAEMTAAAYAVILPGPFHAFPGAVEESSRCGVPVIASATNNIIEAGGDAILLADPASPEEISQQMKVIYKDEQLRNRLSEQGMHMAGPDKWEGITAILSAALSQVIAG